MDLRARISSRLSHADLAVPVVPSQELIGGLGGEEGGEDEVAICFELRGSKVSGTPGAAAQWAADLGLLGWREVERQVERHSVRRLGGLWRRVRMGQE